MKIIRIDGQERLLQLKPWQPPPCTETIRLDLDSIIRDDGDGVMGWYRAARLGKRLVDRGLSIYTADPIGALEAAGRK